MAQERRFAIPTSYCCVFLALLTLIPKVNPQSQAQLVQPSKPAASKAHGYVTNQRQSMVHGVTTCVAGSPSCGTSSSNYDFNPQLLSGVRGYPGLRARVNARGFQYGSALIAPILTQQIRSARLPNINQCIEQLNGCLNVYNLYVSRFRCPQRIILFPAPPNQIVLSVENLDIGVTGNLGGQITLLVPIALFGIVQLNAHQVSIRVSLVIDRAAGGGIYIRVASCYASVGYVDVYVENGGLIGDIANSQFRSISLTQIIQVALNNFGLANLLGGDNGQCPSSCLRKAAAAPNAQNLTALPPPTGFAAPGHIDGLTRRESGPELVAPSVLSTVATTRQQPFTPLASANHSDGKHPTTLVHYGTTAPDKTLLLLHPPPSTNEHKETVDGYKYRYYVSPKLHSTVRRQQPRRAVLPPWPSNGQTPSNFSTSHSSPLGLFDHTTHFVSSSGPIVVAPQKRTRGESGGKWVMVDGSSIVRVRREAQQVVPRPRVHAASPNHVTFSSSQGPNPCANCGSSSSQNPLSFLLVVLQSLDFSKLSNILLTLQVLQTSATNNDYTVDLNGEFSPNGAGGTPFGAFPMYFPQSVGHKMAELLVSDWTINSLLYHLHRSGFISVRIGPETPKIGELLKTTCSSEDDGGLEDHGVETDEPMTQNIAKPRRRRQLGSGGSLADLGICFGDILPAVKEKYPKQRLVVAIRSARAPSIILKAGGIVTLEFVLNGDFYIQSTNQKVGTIQAAATADFTVKTSGGRISAHVDVRQLQLRDVGDQLGLPQDALDNLGNLGKEIILKAANDALEKGAPLNVPSSFGGLPINFVNPEIAILDHAIHIGTDFTVNPAALAQLGSGNYPC